MEDEESNRFSARAARYARVGANVGGVAARIAGARFLGTRGTRHAAALAQALGGLKGPVMKVAQMMATVPDLLPPDYAAELQKLQSEAPPMGVAFVKRRMQAELGADWASRFAAFDLHPAAAASLGQVHRARAMDGAPLACKLQYPDMQSAVEADLRQLDVVFALHRRLNPVIDTREMAKEIGDRVREELDYHREARHAALYRDMLANVEDVRVPDVLPELSTGRLLTMQWLEGRKLLDFRHAGEPARSCIARAIFKAWWIPFSRFGVIHGDAHLGNYSVFGMAEDGDARGINLLDYGCIRIFTSSFVGGVVDLYEGLLHNDFARTVHAYETWGFRGLTKDLAETLNIWARFIYAPMLDDRVRSVADGVSPAHYGRKEAFTVHQALKKKGPVLVPREFVFMDRAAIGLGSAFLHLDATLNFYQLFHEIMGKFSNLALRERQDGALAKAGLPQPA
ncbi:MAG: AarF/UbiB family protein [Beijerinckiaceae bacterium]|nr:AarF/UbiB family protein [Beijerinckiaceae bacterium]MCI0736220.1 AarF/UbiB family protein [Beijerinckiaceae bacterium]